MSQSFFSIRELMELVFCFLEPDSNARNAQVSKSWSQVALDVLWYDIDEFGRLLNLLAPIQTVGHPSRLIFQRPITLNDWQRFSQYSHRIRRLSLEDESRKAGTAHVVSLEALQEIARTRTTFKILPNLRSLTWLVKDVDRRKLSVLFMHEGVTRYTTYAGPTPAHHADVAMRMPNITVLDLRLIENQVRDIVGVSSGFSNLREIIFSRYHLTSDVMEGLAKLKNLERIELSNDPKRICLGVRENLTTFSPKFEIGAFPILTTLSLSVHLTDATAFFQSRCSPPNLTSLRINALSVPSKSSMLDFFTAISSAYSLLQDLHFECIPLEDFLPSREQCLSVDTIRPLFKCTKLTTLRLIHHSPFILTPEDLTEISKQWSSTIETLQLNPEPFIDSPTAVSCLTLVSLIPFASNCPKLQHLGLYMNATMADLPPVEAVTTNFARLKCLYVGASSLVFPVEVAKFLAHLCPLGCRINEEIFWADHNVERGPVITPATSEALEAWAAKWGEVGLLLPALISARVDNTNFIKQLEWRVMALEKEVQRLREQIS